MNKTFLKRNLRDQRINSRSKPRKTLNLIDWIAELGAQKKLCSIDVDYMSLKFFGVFDPNLTAEECEVQPHLLKIVHNKRKHDRTAQEMCGTVIVQTNPNDSANNGKNSTINIPTDKTRPNESILLQLTVKVLEKSSRQLSKRKKMDNMKYVSELIVVDKFQRRLILNGDYEVPLQLAKDLAGSHVTSNMDSLNGNKYLCDIQRLPKLKFHLEWTRVKLDELTVHRPATKCINESNENSLGQNFSGSLQCDPSGLSSLAYLRGGPVRGTVSTETLFYRRNRPKRKLPEIIQINDEFVDEVNNHEAFITGDDRLDDQSHPHVPPDEVDVEPEDENMPGWLEVKSNTMIDKLADVNEAEKALMKMWNIHIIKCGYYCTDIKLRNDCESFIERNGREILQTKLYNNFVLFMVNLYNKRIISPSFFKICIERMQKLARDNNIEL